MASKSVAEQIADLKATREANQKKMGEIAQKSIDEGRSMNDAESAEFDTVEKDIGTLDADIARLTRLESIQRATATSVEKDVAAAKEASAPNGSRKLEPVQVKNTEKLEPGIEFARYAMCQLATKGNAEQAFRLAERHYPQNERIVKALKFQAEGGKFEHIMKATVEAGTTLDATWAAPLVDYQNFAGDFVEFLRPQTIIGQFGQSGVPDLNRIPFNVRIAGQTSGGSAYWVGEGAPKPLTAFDFTATELRWAKAATIAVLTEELIRFSNPSAERLVRDALAGAVVGLLDTDFINPAKAAVSNVSPASILNGATAIPSTGGTDAEAVRCDLQALWAPFITARNPPRTAVYIMNSTTALAASLMTNPLGPREFPGLTMSGGTFNNIPTIVSDYVPDGVVALVNARDVWLADDGQVTIDASREASLQMLDNPTNNSAAGTATSMVSMFQTNSVAFRAERYINWARRRDSGVAYLTGVNWGACGS